MQVSREKLIAISEELDLKMKCFIHKDSQDVVTFPDDLIVGDFDEDMWKEEVQKVESSPGDYIEIERMNATRAFEIMEDFAISIKDNWARQKLLDALGGKKPFAHFNVLIHGMPDQHKNAWFAFKLERMIEFLRRQLEYDDLNAIENTEDD